MTASSSSSAPDPRDLELSAYDYHLPEHLIAQTPAQKREQSRLLVYRQAQDAIEHRVFSELHHYLEAGDVLVVNNSKVFPARVFGKKNHTGTTFEFLLLREEKSHHWEALAKNSKRIRPGYVFDFPDGVQAEVMECRARGHVCLCFPAELDFWSWVGEHGEIPYPPYIHKRESEAERYQTVFAGPTGSVAAPTAGLHFSESYLEEIQQLGVHVVPVTLHVGIGTFMPVRSEKITEHPMHTEHYQLTAATAEVLNTQRAEGKRIIAVGTTATRTLESVYRNHGRFVAESSSTQLFLYPGQSMESIDGLITNFHLPCSSLLMLVATRIGRQKMMDIYAEAIAEAYRFYSFGDAMLLL